MSDKPDAIGIQKDNQSAEYLLYAVVDSHISAHRLIDEYSNYGNEIRNWL